MDQDRAIAIATGYRLDDREVGVRVSVGADQPFVKKFIITCAHAHMGP
jgi:hypothetical protein